MLIVGVTGGVAGGKTTVSRIFEREGAKIIYPRIKKDMGKRAREFGRKNPDAIVIFDVPLLVETGFHREVERVVVITSTEKEQVERLRKRAGVSKEETGRI